MSEQAIRGVVQSLEAAINARDWDGFFSNFTPDADAIVFQSPRAPSREAAHQMMERVWSEIPSDVRASISLESVRFITPEIAVGNLDARFTGSEPHDDRATLVLSRQGGRWLIEAFRVIQPEAAAPPPA